MLGAIVMAVPGWVGGTAVGALAGELLPLSVTRALGVALYAMFMGVVLPPTRHNRVLAFLVPLSMLACWVFTWLFPAVPSLSWLWRCPARPPSFSRCGKRRTAKTLRRKPAARKVFPAVSGAKAS